MTLAFVSRTLSLNIAVGALPQDSIRDRNS